MLKNHLKIGLRNVRKNALYSFINITGLTLGIGVAITLFSIVRFEYSFDQYHSKAERIYRIKTTDKFGEAQSHVHQSMIKALREQFPGVEKAANLYGQNPSVIRVGTAIFNQPNIFFVQPQMLEILDVEWISGSATQSLNAPGKVVLDQETAAKMFKGNALGQTLRYNNETDLTVSGIIKKVPVNSEFPLQMLISWETLRKLQPGFKNEENWEGGDSMDQGFVLLKPNADPKPIEKGMAALALRHKEETSIRSFELQPLSDMHFDTTKDPFKYSMPAWMPYVLISIAAFLILIACINFINLSTVQAIQRSREIGVRKVMGSSKAQLIAQFFGETAVLVFIATLLGSLLAMQLVTFSSELLQTEAGQAAIWDGRTVGFLVLMGLVVTLIAGLYPAMILSGFEPIRSLQNRVTVSNSNGFSLRSSLVVMQFVIAQVLVICTLLAIKQVRYLHEKELGFNKSGIITVAMPDRSSVLRTRFREQLAQYPEIRDVAFGLTTPASKRNHWWSSVNHAALPDGETTFRIQHVDTNYFKFFKIPLIAGRNVTAGDTATAVQAFAQDKKQTSDKHTINVVINQKAARDLGFQNPEKALGQQIRFWGMQSTIVGVAKDYHSEDLKSKMIPHVFFYASWNFQLASIRIDPNQKVAALSHIGTQWKALFPNYYYDAKFLEDDINSFYESERKLSNFLKLFAFIGIIIGALGLFGLVSYVVTQRTKEIGVRKVLGATLYSLVQLLSQDFLKLVVIAFAIASPIAWYAMQQFLKDYTYKADISWWVFLAGGLFSVGIALITVSFQSIRTALMNPVKSLRSE